MTDLGKTYHGNYQKVRSFEKCIEYVTKGRDFISNFDTKAHKEHKAKLTSEDYLKDPLDLLEEGKITFHQINNFLKNQDTYKMLLARKTKRPEIDPPKKRHHWIFGNSNTGKTTYLRKQMNEVDGGWFQIPLNNDWKGYNGERNLYVDEFKGQISVQELN
nr:MAG: rep protein [Cressdnaviricota sp.]